MHGLWNTRMMMVGCGRCWPAGWTPTTGWRIVTPDAWRTQHHAGSAERAQRQRDCYVERGGGTVAWSTGVGQRSPSERSRPTTRATVNGCGRGVDGWGADQRADDVAFPQSRRSKTGRRNPPLAWQTGSPHGPFYVMTLARTIAGIDRAEDAERRTGKSSPGMLCGGTSKWRWPRVPKMLIFR